MFSRCFEAEKLLKSSQIIWVMMVNLEEHVNKYL